MDSLSSAEDLNNYEDLVNVLWYNILKIQWELYIDHYNALRKEKSNSDNLLVKLQKDVENLQKSEKNLTEQLCKMCVRNENENCMSNLYEKLKENCTNLDKKYNGLLQDKEILQENHSLQVIELKERYEEQRNQTIEELEKKLRYVRTQLERERNLFLERESKLYNELQLAQASNALQYDESEAKVESLQLQLRDTPNSHDSLRQDYVSLKTQSKYELETANKHKLRITEQQLRINQEQMLNYNSNSNHSINAKYDALDIINTSSAGQLSDKYEVSHANVSNIRSVTKVINNNIARGTKKSYLPGLKQLSKPGQKLTVQKKRKLYNPALDIINTSSAGQLSDKYEVSHANVSNIRSVTKVINNIARGTKKSYLPGLKQLAKPGQKLTVQKKRKLYNPGKVNFEDFQEIS